MSRNNGIVIIPLLLTAMALSSVCCTPRGRIALDPDSKSFFEYGRLIMTRQEREIFLMLPDKQSRQEFIQDFWDKRDPDPQTEENEFKEEFHQRIEYVNKRFREGIPGWKTDRGRIYIYLGAPDKVEQRPFINDPNVKGLIWWGYYRYQLGIEFVDRTGDGRYSLSRQAGAAGGLLDVIEKAKFGRIFAEGEDTGRVLADFRVAYDTPSKEIFVSLPVEALSFEAEAKKLTAEFSLDFYIYSKKNAAKHRFTRTKIIEMTEDEALEMEQVVLTFPYASARAPMNGWVTA